MKKTCKNKDCNTIFEPKKHNQSYCSPDCRNTDHVRRWRQKTMKMCPMCNSKILKESDKCRKCCRRNVVDITLTEALYKKYINTSAAYNLVRRQARHVISKLGWNSCQICGYDKHVEAAHVKAIVSFPTDTLLSVINHPSNLKSLCRNCHWEFDHGLIPLAGVEPA